MGLLKNFRLVRISIHSNINPFRKNCVDRKVRFKFLPFKFVSPFGENEKNRRINVMVPITFDYSFAVEKY